MAFKNIRRQKFLSEVQFKQHDEWLSKSISGSFEELEAGGLIPAAEQSFRWAIASERLEQLILRYTAGAPLADLAARLPEVIQAFDEFIPIDKPEIPNEAYTLDIPQLEAYVYVMWLFCLCQLLGHSEQIPRIIAWLDRRPDQNRGLDGLFEIVVEKLTGQRHQSERVVLHPVYVPLARAVVPEATDRAALVKEFVENWYKKMKPCYWYGTHTDGDRGTYFGYWCFEAALVTYLWDIDDSSYRDHLVYPKDLVDYARANHPYKGPETGSSTRPPRTPGGEPCPKEGYWFTPANSDSRRHFKQGEVMPDFKNSLWATLWQWDENQKEPKGG